MEGRGRYLRSSSRSRTSSTNSVIDPKEKIKDCFRKFVAFMCTQVGVGALVISYTLIGAVSFMKIEAKGTNDKLKTVKELRSKCAFKVFQVAKDHNIFNKSLFSVESDKVLKQYQDQLVEVFKHGYDERSAEEIWTFPAALMFSLSIITMIGYGKLVPKTGYGKLAAGLYALFGIPLYILYFLNMGEVLAGCFKWFYTWLYECSTERDENEPPKRIIVPSTACLWVISAYIMTGAIMFANWEGWSYLNSTYFCIISLCKIGFGDFVPGANSLQSNDGNQTKLMITFFYILLGLGLVAMCYNLMREEIRVKVQEMTEDFGQCLEDTKERLMLCCDRYKGSEEYY